MLNSFQFKMDCYNYISYNPNDNQEDNTYKNAQEKVRKESRHFTAKK